MRMTRAGAWAGASTTTLVFLFLAWFLPNVLGLEGGQLWILRGTLAFLGLVAGFLLQRMLVLRARSSSPRKKDPEEERLKLLLKEARSRLAAAEQAGTSRISRLPVLMVLGPPGSTKTTVVLQSGMDPDLLAGEVHRGDTVAPTEAVNLWYGDGVVVVEAGSDITEDGDRWSRLIRKLRPARLGAALLRRPQAPRVALLCVSCEEFLKPGASSSLPELARSLRARLSDAARGFGIHLPVYVLFTKADRLPHFAEFVRNLTPEEAGEAVGVTLPLKAFSSSGAYADEQTRRLDWVLDELEVGLAAKRLDLLPRENSEELRQAAYEFPREIGKLSEPIREFLVELCRPRHLGTSPVLRGFYFTGVRPVYLRDRASEMMDQPSIQEEPSTAGATAVFSAERVRQEMERQEQSSGGGGRKVPQWVFLRRMVHDVIFQDRAAMGLTGSGVGVSLLRRFVLGGVMAAAVITLFGMGVSFFTNRGLQGDVAMALGAVQAPPTSVDDGAVEADEAPTELPLPELRGLDSLGAELDRLREWADGRPPFRYRWGLYRGPALLPEVRTAYFHRFRELLWSDTRDRMVAFLRELPPEPEDDSDYEATYNALKAYLITTEHPERSDVTFLPPVLLSHSGTPSDEENEMADLLRRQFQRFARELQVGNPYEDRASESLVSGTRRFLGEFAAVDRFYQALVSRVSTQLEGFHFHDAYPGSRSALRNEFAVPGAFTREGWDVVQAILEDPDALLVSEEWVVGEQAVTPEERAALAQEIGTRYEREYVTRWQDFLRAARVPAFDSNLSSASGALDLLGGNDSPLVQMLTAVSRHTAVEAEEVRAPFQPVHHLIPPPTAADEDEEEADEPDEENIRDYLDGLLNLRSSLDDLPGSEGARLEQGVIQAERDASQVERTIGQMSRDFEREGGARVAGDAVARLLEEPITWATRLLGRYEATQAAEGVNQQGAQLCQRFGDVTRLYPFAAGAASDAQVDDVKALFQPGQSHLSAFHQEVMEELVTRAGGRYEPRPGATPPPTAEFLQFYNRADRVSRALFDSSGEGPVVTFFLRVEASQGIPEIEVFLDGQRQIYTPTAAPLREFVWEGEQARSMRIEAQVAGSRRTIAEAEGPWAAFRIFQRAERWTDLGGGSYRVAWQIPEEGTAITADVTFADPGSPVLRPGFLSGLNCVSRVAR